MFVGRVFGEERLEFWGVFEGVILHMGWCGTLGGY